MGGKDRHCYTLLADDSSAYSYEARACDAFLAHLVYSLIVNGHVVFSDNQIVSSPNLRRLAARNGLIRRGFEEKLFSIAIRSDFNGRSGIASLGEVHEAFVRERKLGRSPTLREFSRELQELQKNAEMIPWHYETVRTNFTQRCQDLLHNRFRETGYDPDQHARFIGLIAEERERGQGGLGREPLLTALPRRMRRANLPTPRGTKALIRECIDAPYVSNLPLTLGLNPIYAVEHEASFMLLRGNAVTFRDLAPPRAVERTMSYQQFVRGLLELDLDDVLELQATRAAKLYRRLQRKQIIAESDVTAIEDAFFALNTEIERRIYRRVYPAASGARTGERLELRRQYATRFEHGFNIAIDVIAIVAGTYFGGPALGVTAKVVLDIVKSNTVLGAVSSLISDRIAEGPVSADAAGRAAQARERAALEAHFRKLETDAKLSISEVVQTHSFDKETVVR